MALLAALHYVRLRLNHLRPGEDWRAITEWKTCLLTHVEASVFSIFTRVRQQSNGPRLGYGRGNPLLRPSEARFLENAIDFFREIQMMGVSSALTDLCYAEFADGALLRAIVMEGVYDGAGFIPIAANHDARFHQATGWVLNGLSRYVIPERPRFHWRHAQGLPP